MFLSAQELRDLLAAITFCINDGWSPLDGTGQDGVDRLDALQERFAAEVALLDAKKEG